MRKLSLGILGGLVALVGFAGAAHASATVDLIWGGGGSVTTPSSSSSSISLSVVITAGANGLQSFGISVEYSGLTVTGFTNGAAPPLFFTLGNTTDDGGHVHNFNGSQFNTSTFVGAGSTYLAGTITFHVGAASIFSVAPVFVGSDAMASQGFVNITADVIANGLNGSSGSHPVPEPTTAALLALGLGGLALVGRRR